MTLYSSYLPIFELTRGQMVESLHFGAVAVVAADGALIAWYGDPDTVTFLRSSAKPFQALPFISWGGADHFSLTQREVAILCASHSGTDDQAAVVRSILAKAGLSESELLCGVHPPYDEATAWAMNERGEEPSAVRHNCSGKHSGMLSFARLKAQDGESNDELDYIDPAHPIQKEILSTFAKMCRLPLGHVKTGIDGCSAPNFAVPLRNAALAFARLCDPLAGGVEPAQRASACQMITTAMMAHPDMVAGPGRFDTLLMEVARGRLISKGGAEGYQGIGLMPGALGPGSPAMGITLKIADGDDRRKVRSTVAMEVLHQLGALSAAELQTLADFGPGFPIYNWRKIVVGQAYPVFELKRTR